MWHRLPTAVPIWRNRRVSDDPGRVVDQAPASIADPGRAFDVGVARNRTDGEHTAIDPNITEVSHRVDVHQDGRARKAEPHGRNEALPPRQHAGFRTMLLQEGDGLVSRTRTLVFEGCGNHLGNLLRLEWIGW